MSIKKADMPTLRKGGVQGKNIKDVQDFVDSGWECAEVELDGRKLESARVGLCLAVKRMNVNGVRIASKNGHLYLVRVGGHDED